MLTTNTTVECDGRDDANEFFCAIETAVINRVLTRSDHILFCAVLKRNLRTRGSFFWWADRAKMLMNRLEIFSSGSATDGAN